MIKKYLIVFLLIVLSQITHAKQTILLGRLELVKILPEQLQIEAKLDTGAYVSSLHADSIQEHDVEGKRWVKFKYRDPRSGQLHEFDKPLQRYVRVKKRFEEKTAKGNAYSVRPVVKIKLCLAGAVKEVEVNLTNRAHFKQKLLVGRKTMHLFSVIIDPVKEFLTLPNCS